MNAVLLVKVTLLFLAGLIALADYGRATAAMRHLLCVSRSGRVASYSRRRAIAGKGYDHPAAFNQCGAASQNAARAGSWPSLEFTSLMLALWAAGCISLLLPACDRSLAHCADSARPLSFNPVSTSPM